MSFLPTLVFALLAKETGESLDVIVSPQPGRSAHEQTLICAAVGDANEFDSRVPEQCFHLLLFPRVFKASGNLTNSRVALPDRLIHVDSKIAKYSTYALCFFSYGCHSCFSGLITILGARNQFRQ